jgi:TetR/AcrR family transcriptional regulator
MTAHDSKDETRELLIKVARDLFAKHGLDGVTVRDIAEKAGVNVASISYHFEGKEGLYKAVVEEFAKAKQTKAQGIFRPVQSAEEFKILFRLFVTEFLNDVLEAPEGCQILLREIDAGLPHCAEIFEKTLMVNFKLMIKFIDDARERGYLKKDLNPQLVAMMIQGIIFHLQKTEGIRKRFFKESLYDLKFRQQAIDNICIVLLDGIMKNPKE